MMPVTHAPAIRHDPHSEALAGCRASHVSIKWSVIFNRWPLVLISASFYCLMRRAMYSDWGELKRLISQMGRGRADLWTNWPWGLYFLLPEPTPENGFPKCAIGRRP